MFVVQDALQNMPDSGMWVVCVSYKLTFITTSKRPSEHLEEQGGPPPNGAGAPIDGGVVALVVGSALYSYKKLSEQRNNK